MAELTVEPAAASMMGLTAELITRFPYLAAWAVLTVGLGMMVMGRHHVKRLIGLVFVQSSVILFFMAMAVKPGGTAPIVDHYATIIDPSHYINPLPHVLMLTAIVVGVATQGVAFMLLRRIFNARRSLEDQLERNHPETGDPEEAVTP